MKVNFEPIVGEEARCTVMEQASALWNYYEADVDTVRELVGYLNIAIDAQIDRELIEGKRGVLPPRPPRRSNYVNY